MNISNIIQLQPIYTNNKIIKSNNFVSLSKPIIDTVEISSVANNEAKNSIFFKDKSYLYRIYNNIKHNINTDKANEFIDFAKDIYDKYSDIPVSKEREEKINIFLLNKPYTAFTYNILKEINPNEANVYIEYYMENYGLSIYDNEYTQFPSDPHMADSLLMLRGITTGEELYKRIDEEYFLKETSIIDGYFRTQDTFIDEMLQDNIAWSSDYEFKGYMYFYTNFITHEDIEIHKNKDFDINTGEITIYEKETNSYITYNEFMKLTNSNEWDIFADQQHRRNFDIVSKYGDEGIKKYVENYLSNLTSEEKELIKKYDYFSLPAFKNVNISGIDEFIKPLNEIRGVRKAIPNVDYEKRYYELEIDKMKREFIYPLYKVSELNGYYDYKNKNIMQFIDISANDSDLVNYRIVKNISHLNNGFIIPKEINKENIVTKDDNGKLHNLYSINKILSQTSINNGLNGTNINLTRHRNYYEVEMENIIFQEIDGEIYRMGTLEQKQFLERENNTYEDLSNLTEELYKKIEAMIEQHKTKVNNYL